MSTMPTRLISFPHIDQDQLEATIAHEAAKLPDMEIRSRSQAMLADALDKEKVLEADLKQARVDKSRLEQNLNDLHAIYDRMSTSITDVEVELNAVRQIASLLKAAGVEL